MAEELTPRQSPSIDEYLIKPNGTQAAIRADFSPATAAQQASRLLKNVKVQQTIATRQKQLAEKRARDGERLVNEAETNLEIARTGGYKGAGSANGALEFIGRVTGLLNEKQQPGSVAVTKIVINLAPRVVPPDQPQVIEMPCPNVEGDYRDIPEGG